MSSITIRICQVVVVTLLLGSLNVYSLKCEDDRCKTGLCNSANACICNLPDPSTILNGDRAFLGGKFCNEEMTMCDGTNSFWCEHGATCEEIVQGEKYSCKCPLGFAGEHCEHSGTPCGQTFCFHNAECLADAGEVCQCPSEWKGNADCSLPTKPTDFYSNSTSTKLAKVNSSYSNKTLVVLAFSSVGAAAGGAIYGKKLFSNKKREDVKFQQLSEMQTQGILDDDDENHNMVSQRVHGDISHI